MARRLRARELGARFLLPAMLALSPLAAQAQDAAGAESGKRIFTTEAEPRCSICHSLADAGAVGKLGPNLDDLKPDEEKVRAAVTSGVGVMPPDAETLSAEQIAAVARYVATALGSAK
jgi:cytochrome c6